MTGLSTTIVVALVIFAIVLYTLWYLFKRGLFNSPILKGNNLNSLNKNEDKRVIIIGGGLTGLITAYQLEKAHIPYILLESQPHVGGRIATVRYTDGGTSEAPLEEYWQRSPTIKILKELGIKMHEDAAHSSVIIDNEMLIGNGDPDADQYLGNMFNAQEKDSFLKWNDKTWKIYERIHDKYYNEDSPNRNKQIQDIWDEPLKKVSFADWVKADKLPRKVEEWIRITLEPEIATEWDKICALDAIDEFRIFLKTSEGFGESNYHLYGGNTQFIKGLVNKLAPGSIHLNCNVTHVSSKGNSVEVTYLQNSPADVKQVYTIAGKYAVSTIPISEIHNIRFEPQLDAERKMAIETTRFGSYIKVHLRLHADADELWKKYGDNIFTLLTDSLIGAVYNASAEANDKSNSQKNHSVDELINLTVLVHGKQAKTLSQLTFSEIEQIVTTRLESLFPGFTKYVKQVEVFTFPQAVAYWPVHLGRSRFDHLAHKLRQPFGNIFIGSDMCYGSHSESAAISALNISKAIIQAQNGK